MATKQNTPTIASLLRTQRGDRYKSEAARTIGVSRQIYDAWEAGLYVPGDDWAERLATYLEIELPELVWLLFQNRVGAAHNPRDVVWVARPIHHLRRPANLTVAA